MIRYTVFFTGHVQGVGFCSAARDAALTHQVRGYVRVLDDGRVLLVIEGEENKAVNVFEEVLDKMRPHIRNHTLCKSPATREFGCAFNIRH